MNNIALVIVEGVPLPVPFILCTGERQIRIREGHFGLANVAPTILDLFGIEIPDSWEESVLED